MNFKKLGAEQELNTVHGKDGVSENMSTVESYTLISPSEAIELPLVLDSPHSGIKWPDDVRTIATENQLKSGWDAHVDKLWRPVVDMGAYLICAHYSRMLIDLNRAGDDIDPLLLNYPGDSCRPTAYSERGMGLLRKFSLPGIPMYDYKLSETNVMQRISRYYAPYHAALKLKLDELHASYNGVWHINCHSMKSVANQMNSDSGSARPDVVLGDNDGAAATPAFVDVVEKAFTALGYKVARNTPYKGGFLVTDYGNPECNRHSLQIELNRALYMDEKTFAPSNNFESVKQDLATVVSLIVRFVRSEIT